MWWRQASRGKAKYKFKKRSAWLLSPSFQRSYALRLVFLVSLPMISGISIAYYFINQNFKIFLEMAYRYSPELILHLDRERGSVQSILILIGLSSLVYIYVFGIIQSYRMIGPIYALKNHVSNLTRGDWSQPELKTRSLDEYKDVVEAYNYFYRSLRRQSQWELEQLKQISLPKHALESRERMQALLNYKAEQIGEDSNIPALDTRWEDDAIA